MDACHLLLGRPWQSDLDANHKGRDNFSIFLKNGQKSVLNGHKDWTQLWRKNLCRKGK